MTLPSTRPHPFGRLVCLVAGHDWALRRIFLTAWKVVPVEPWTGCDLDCRRCGATLRDYDRFRQLANEIATG